MPGYRVEHLIGVGGYGEVWQGRVRATGAAVALKRIPLVDVSQRQAALSEAAVLSELDHPHLLHLHRLVPVDGALVLVLDLASGGTLARLLAARGRLTPGEAITALAPIGAALAYLHNAGVVHGDVTPANVLLTGVGLPLLADLGVARLLGDHAPVRTTPEYADPTVAAGYLPSPASDVFMLGAVSVHTLTGHLPWQGAAPGERAASARWQQDVARRLDAAGAAREMAAVVLRALTLEPERRGTAADFALDLRNAGQPVAVELRAGRSRLEPSLARLAAIAAQRPVGGAAVGGAARGVAKGPADNTAGGTDDGTADCSGPVPALPFTHGARAPSPLVPREPRHGAGGRSLAVSTPVAVLTIVLGLVVAASAWWLSTGGTGGTGGNGAARLRAAGDPGPSGLSVRSSALAPAPTDVAPSRPRLRPAWPLDRHAALRVLEQLDAERSAAFAARDPGLLRHVYAEPGLRARDAALLIDVVPVGCGLRGVHTSFTAVRVVGHDADVVRVRARAVLASSTLVCGTTRAGSAPGAGPSALRIELTRTDGGYRIASQREAA